ncbi:Serine/threonine-protein kinase 16 [Daphnia magna]|uniref:Serine/threonine-protein kinase 16 n=1 Tax=Daphnia magna TaxID=35525 RepID=A0A164L6Q6_9CRUS|nr:Serine/threonine-protein kinase 16 [Daphnia magna]
MPNESQVLYQITNGVDYLHGKGIVHGDLNPLNVVIAAQSLPVRMKISDFGLSKFSYSKQLLEKGENISSEVKLCLRKYWTLSKKTYSLEGIKDATEDVIAAGCILFYYLKRGKHLFGNDSKSILENLKKNNPVNLEGLGENHFAYEPIKNMINPPGKGFSWLHIANDKFKEALSRKSRISVSFQVNTGKLLGSGTYGYVYEGKFDGNRVAVKQMTTTTSQKEIIQREMNTHIELNHVNVVKLLDVADSADNRFTHLALELCGGTLADYCKEKYSGPELPPDELVLYQIANGLHYIHSRNLVHRDIKPDNILISMSSPVQMKVSDLSFVKKTREDIFSQSKIRGTLQWMAPERLKVLNDTENMPVDLPDGTIKSDTFSSGCVFFYFLTRGKHPFGKNQATVPANILKNKQEELVSYKQNLAADDVNGRIPAGLIKLIEDMIQFKEEDRIGLPEVIKQLAAVLYGMDKSKCQLRLVDVSLGGKYSISSHPTELILACANEEKLIFYTAENLAIPFSNWRKKKEIPLQPLKFECYCTLDWNINGTRLAAGFIEGAVVVWSYPECEILFQKKLRIPIEEINWNPTRSNLFAAYLKVHNHVFVCDSSIGDVITIIDCKRVTAVKWISENRIAVSSSGGKIEIFEMEENNLTTTRLVKEFTHGKRCYYLEWNERTQYLASFGDKGIQIWSMDDDKPIYSVELENCGSEFAWRLCTGNGEEEGGIEIARKSAKNFTFA